MSLSSVDGLRGRPSVIVSWRLCLRQLVHRLITPAAGAFVCLSRYWSSMFYSHNPRLKLSGAPEIPVHFGNTHRKQCTVMERLLLLLRSVDTSAYALHCRLSSSHEITSSHLLAGRIGAAFHMNDDNTVNGEYNTTELLTLFWHYSNLYV